jgi:hypothetical protein
MPSLQTHRHACGHSLRLLLDEVGTADRTRRRGTVRMQLLAHRIPDARLCRAGSGRCPRWRRPPTHESERKDAPQEETSWKRN